MLTQADVESLGATVATSHKRRNIKGPVERIRFINGPLTNVETVVEAASSRALCIGWCIVTNAGPVQVMYKHATGAGELIFARYFSISRSREN